MELEFQARVALGTFRYEAEFEMADELVVLFGHSGAGKSVTLQLIAGLLKPDAARISLGGRLLTDTATRVYVPPQARGVGYVVQELALFPHMSVLQNVAFGAPAAGSAATRRERIRGILASLGMQGFEDRKPHTLSGGQRQRVALARALARDARILLLDEPFSALDESLRHGLRRELLRLRGEFGLPIVFVTHDLREAHLLADRLAVFDEGRLLQFGPREEVFRRPISSRVAELIGFTNILDATIVERDGSMVRLACCGVTLLAGPLAHASAFAPGQRVKVAIRAERVNLRRGEPGDPNVLNMTVEEDLGYGSIHALRLAPAGAGPVLTVEIAVRPYDVLGVAYQREWMVELPPPDIHVMPS